MAPIDLKNCCKKLGRGPSLLNREYQGPSRPLPVFNPTAVGVRPLLSSKGTDGGENNGHDGTGGIGGSSFLSSIASFRARGFGALDTKVSPFTAIKVNLDFSNLYFFHEFLEKCEDNGFFILKNTLLNTEGSFLKRLKSSLFRGARAEAQAAAASAAEEVSGGQEESPPVQEEEKIDLSNNVFEKTRQKLFGKGFLDKVRIPGLDLQSDEYNGTINLKNSGSTNGNAGEVSEPTNFDRQVDNSDRHRANEEPGSDVKALPRQFCNGRPRDSLFTRGTSAVIEPGRDSGQSNSARMGTSSVATMTTDNCDTYNNIHSNGLPPQSLSQVGNFNNGRGPSHPNLLSSTMTGFVPNVQRNGSGMSLSSGDRISGASGASSMYRTRVSLARNPVQTMDGSDPNDATASRSVCLKGRETEVATVPLYEMAGVLGDIQESPHETEKSEENAELPEETVSDKTLQTITIGENTIQGNHTAQDITVDLHQAPGLQPNNLSNPNLNTNPLVTPVCAPRTISGHSIFGMKNRQQFYSSGTLVSPVTVDRYGSLIGLNGESQQRLPGGFGQVSNLDLLPVPDELDEDIDEAGNVQGISAIPLLMPSCPTEGDNDTPLEDIFNEGLIQAVSKEVGKNMVEMTFLILLIVCYFYF